MALEECVGFLPHALGSIDVPNRRAEERANAFPGTHPTPIN